MFETRGIIAGAAQNVGNFPNHETCTNFAVHTNIIFKEGASSCRALAISRSPRHARHDPHPLHLARSKPGAPCRAICDPVPAVSELRGRVDAACTVFAGKIASHQPNANHILVVTDWQIPACLPVPMAWVRRVGQTRCHQRSDGGCHLQRLGFNGFKAQAR